MPKFKYAARNAAGKQEVGTLDAASSDDAVTALQKQGLLVISVTEAAEVSLVRPAKTAKKAARPAGRRGRVKADDLVFFARQFSSLVSAGIPLVRALRILEGQLTSGALVAITEQVIKDVEAGKTLAASFSRHPRVFSGFWINLVETGEAAGQLAAVLGQTADYLEARAALRRKIVSALIYPAILLTVATVAIVVFTVFVVPIFQNVFTSLEAELPALTKVVLAVSGGMRRYFVWLVLAGIGVVAAVRTFLSAKPGRLAFDKALLGFPVLGELFRNSSAEEFSRGLGILVRSGIPILQALEIVSRSSTSPLVGDMISDVQKEVRQGRPIGASLERYAIFPPVVGQMISVGEETGELGGMLERLSSFCKERVDTTITRITTLFEPVLLVIMAGLIGTLVVSMYLPIFKLGQALK